MDVINDLVGNPAVVLQDVEVLCTRGEGDLLCHGEQLGQGVIGDVRELLAVVLGNDELIAALSVHAVRVSRDAEDHGCEHAAWPLLNGLMSKKANVFSLSKSFIEGISPARLVRQRDSRRWLAACRHY